MGGLIAIILLALVGCGSGEGTNPKADLGGVGAYRDSLCSKFDIAEVPRCDRVTFDSLVAAYCPGARSISKYYRYYAWHRDVKACFTTVDVGSKSECSLDGYLSVVHYALERRRPKILKQIIADLEPRGWRCGAGPIGVTSIYPIRSLIFDAASAADRQEPLKSIPNPLAGFRGHLLGMYLWADWKANGRLPAYKVQLLKALRREQPDSPFFEALVARFTNQNYERAVALTYDLLDPSNYWGSAPLAAYVAASVAVMEGR